MVANQQPLEQRYSHFSTIRSPFLERAYKCSDLSIPSLINRGASNRFATTTGTGGGESFEVPWQSMAARCVNNLASKLMLTLLPPNMPFFRLVVEGNASGDEDGLDPQLKSEVDRGLSKIERVVVERAASGSDRVVVHEALKHLIVGGNALLYLPPESEPARCFCLDSYVVRRAPSGEVREIIVREAVAFSDLPDPVQAFLNQSDASPVVNGTPSNSSNSDTVLRSVDVYTGIMRDGDRWTVRQECKGLVLPGSKGAYPKDACPWIPMRFIRVDGEDYGRSYVEEYYGDISSLDALYQALIEGSAAAAKVLFLINPNSTLRAEDITEAPNLGFVTGMRDDVMTLQLEKYADFRVAKEMVAELERRLSHAFILNSAVQRDGERVTAEEIRRMVEDLEAALGGVYSLMAVEFQLPYVRVRLKQLEAEGVLPALPSGVVKPAIVTGVEALGRGNDKSKLQELGDVATRLLGPEAAFRYIDPLEYLRRLITASGIDEDGLLAGPEELEQGAESQQMLGLAEKLGPSAIKAFSDMASDDPAAALQALPPTNLDAQQGEL